LQGGFSVAPLKRRWLYSGAMRLVLHATNTIQIGLNAAVVVGALGAVAHAPVVSEVANALTGTPPVAAEADIVEIATGIAAVELP
jgi:hypothetical protein